MLDFRLTGPVELRWYRHYDSAQSHRSFSFGNGCAHEYDLIFTLHDDGLVYEEPVGRSYQFPPLQHDGEAHSLHGLILKRISSGCYHVHRHAKPVIEFILDRGIRRARVARLLQGPAEVVFQYDATQRLIGINDSAGRVITAEEDEQRRLVGLAVKATPSKPGYLIITYSYDDLGNLIATRYPEGHGYAFGYDEDNRMILRRGRKGFHFYFKYDAKGRCVRAMGDDRLYGVALDYLVSGKHTKISRPDQGVWSYKFDAHGGLQNIIDPLGGITTFVRDTFGRQIAEVDANGNVTTLVYDAAGAAIKKIDPLGNSIDLPEDVNAPDPSYRRVACNGAEFEFGRLFDFKNITLPRPDQAKDLPISWEVRSRLIVRPAYVEEPRLKEEFNVRPLGVLWWPKPALGRIFNDFGKLVQQRDEFGRTRQWTYDASGNEASYTDFDGGRWIYDHASWHMLRSVTNPLGANVRYEYTTYEEIASFVDAGGTRSDYRYDLKDHLVEVRRHGVVRDVYTKDAVGNLVAKHAGDGSEMLRIEIGAGNLPIRKTLASGDEHTFQYDASGRPLVASTNTTRIDFTYNDRGDCVREICNGFGVEHDFTGKGLASRSILFDRFVITYARDSENTIVLIDPGKKSHTLKIFSNGIVERRLSNGSHEVAQYDILGRCLLKYMVRSGETWIRQYHWSGESELRRVDDSLQGETRHDYDSAHRLIRRHCADGRIENYEMDNADNLLAQPGLAGVELMDGNRLKCANGSDFSYNIRNHLGGVRNHATCRQFFYDSRDQLIRIQTSLGTWTADYDALGRRIQKTWDGQTTRYFWNADQLIAEVSANGRLRLYIYLDMLALSPFLFLDYENVSSLPCSGQRYFIHSDQIGTPILIENDQQEEVWRATVAPFGQVAIASSSRIEFNLRFPGHYYDVETGLHYNRFRYYDPVLGRYLQSDPWGIAGGCNLYAYRSNPLADVDARGLGEENKKKGKPCPDEEGTLSAGQALAKEKGLPPAPEGYHWMDVGGQPRLRSNPGSDNPPLMFNTATGEFQERPPAAAYPRVGFTDDERQKVFDQAKGPDGKVRCPCGEPIPSANGDDMDMGHKPGQDYATARDDAIQNGTPRSDFRAQQKDLSGYRPEHPGCNRSHEHE